MAKFAKVYLEMSRGCFIDSVDFIEGNSLDEVCQREWLADCEGMIENDEDEFFQRTASGYGTGEESAVVIFEEGDSWFEAVDSYRYWDDTLYDRFFEDIDQLLDA